MAAPVAHAPSASAADALTVVSRLLALAVEQPEPRVVHVMLVEEARRLLEADGAALVTLAGGGRVLAATTAADLGAEALSVLRGAVARRTRLVPLADAGALGPLIGGSTGGALVAPVGAAELLVHAALGRAAKNLHESLELPVVLSRICHEAAGIMGADIAIVSRATAGGGARAEAAFGCGPELAGYRLEPGRGLAGKVLQAGRAMRTDEYDRIADLPRDSPYRGFRAGLAVPFDWGAEAAVAELRRNAGSQFDPAVVEALLEIVRAQSA